MTIKQDYSHLRPAHASPQSDHYLHHVNLKEICDGDCWDINPDYQRETVAKIGWKRRLINSILSGESIGLLEGYKHYEVKEKLYWEIMDGHQRIDTIRQFRRNEFKTWTISEKAHMEPESELEPIEGGRYFDQLLPRTKAYFLDYHLAINKATQTTIGERVTRFRSLNAGHILSPAEQKHIHPSSANFFARRLAKNIFWDDFYIGDTTRKKVFLSSLYLLSLQIDPERMVDLRRSLYVDHIAMGQYDQLITEIFIENVEKNIEDMSILYTGMQFSDRATAIIMYQSVHLLQQHGFAITQKHKGCLASWLANIIAGSRAPGMPGYNMPVQKILSAKGQQEFWERNLNTVLALVRVATFG